MTIAVSHRAAIPPLEPSLKPGEEILFLVDAGATTVFDGPGGFLILRMWETVVPPPLGQVVLLGYVWMVTSEFVVGSMGREPLRRLLNRRAVAEMHVVQGLLDEKLTKKEKAAWYGIIMAEAATVFADGAGAVQQPTMSTLKEAKAWVLTKLAALLEAEEEVSQVMVLGPNGTGYELLPSSWPLPGFIDVSHDWIEIEGQTDDLEGEER